MALLDKDKVAAHAHDMGHAHPLPGGEYFDVGALSTGDPVLGVVVRDLRTRPVYEVRTPKSVRLVDAPDGAAVSVDDSQAGTTTGSERGVRSGLDQVTGS